MKFDKVLISRVCNGWVVAPYDTCAIHAPDEQYVFQTLGEAIHDAAHTTLLEKLQELLSKEELS